MCIGVAERRCTGKREAPERAQPQAPERAQLQGSREGLGPLDFQAPERALLQGPREVLDRPEEPELLKSRNTPWYVLLELHPASSHQRKPSFQG